MTDKQVEEINKLVKNCKYNTSEVCRLQVLPCTRVIDQGRCPEIIDYLRRNKDENMLYLQEAILRRND